MKLDIALTAAEVSLSMLNAGNKKPQIESGVTAKLDVKLTNDGAPIPLVAGQDASKLKVFLPRYVDPTAIKAMTITLADWDFAVEGVALTLTYSGAGGAWDGFLSFTIDNVTVTGSPADGRAQINFDHMPGAPGMVTQPLPLVQAEKPGNASLSDVLGVSLDSRGTVYVSKDTDPLANTLFLNLKNIGPEALYTGGGSPSGARVTVEFCYGSTSGALAPADPKDRAAPPVGSAWNIQGAVYSDQTEGWRITPATSSDKVPIWTLQPLNTNKNLIGTGAHSNVTFDFSQIVALSAPGHTQMIVSFSGFKKTDKKDYDDMVVVLDVVKEPAPPNRGLLDFFSKDNPILPVATPATKIKVSLNWSMADVNKITLITDRADLPPVTKTYAKPPATPEPLAYDDHCFELTGIKESGPMTVTAQAKGGNQEFLNAYQFTVYFQMQSFVDPRDGHVYKTARFGSTFWMLQNLMFNDPSGSRIYGDDPNLLKAYGRLYATDSNSVTAPPGGWRVPTLQDWQQLFAFFGDDKAAFAALMKTGTDDFAAVLGGKYLPSSGFSDIAQMGYYMLSGADTFAGFSAGTKSTSLAGAVYPGELLSLRYVKDV